MWAEQRPYRKTNPNSACNNGPPQVLRKKQMPPKKQKMSFDHTLDITIPFETNKQSTIAKTVLEPDPIMRPDDIKVRYLVDGNSLIIKFEAVSDRTLRVATSSVLESLKTVIETIDEFENVQLL